MFRSTLANLGSGIRSVDHQTLPNSALTEAKTSIQENASVDMHVSIVRSEQTMHKQLGLDAATVRHKATHEVDLHSNEKKEMVKRLQWDSQKVYVMIRKTLRQSSALGTPVTLNQTASSTIAEVIANQDNTAVFFNTYGDRYISQIYTGAEVVIIAELDVNTSGSYSGTYNNKAASSKEKQKLLKDKQKELVKTTTKDNSTDFSEIATYAEKDVTNYWIHTAGLESSKAFVANTKSFADFLNSVMGLLKFDEPSLSTVRLGYQTIAYNTVSIDKPSVKTENGDSVTRAQITKYLLDLEERAQENKSKRLDILDIINRATYFLEKYDNLVKIIYEKTLDQKNHATEDGKIIENRQALQSMISELTSMDKQLIAMSNAYLYPAYSPATQTTDVKISFRADVEGDTEISETKEVTQKSAAILLNEERHKKLVPAEKFRDLVAYESLLKKIIGDYPATRAYTQLGIVSISSEERASDDFKINFNKGTKFIYLRLHNGSQDPGAVALQVQTAKPGCYPCGGSAKYKNLFTYNLKAAGDYVPTSAIPPNSNFRLALIDHKQDNHHYGIDILDGGETEPFTNLVF